MQTTTYADFLAAVRRELTKNELAAALAGADWAAWDDEFWESAPWRVSSAASERVAS